MKYIGLRRQRMCSMCGSKYMQPASYHKTRRVYMVQEKICLHCAEWIRIMEDKNTKKYVEIIDNVAYRFLKPARKRLGTMLGGDGKMKYIVKKDGTCKGSNDVWIIGEVPQYLREKYPNTGWWISNKYGARLNKDNFTCEARGCYDRYHCYRYDYRQEFESGPYNIPPLTWKVGDERCMSFVNIQEIKNYNYFDINDLSIDNEENNTQDNRYYASNQAGSGDNIKDKNI